MNTETDNNQTEFHNEDTRIVEDIENEHIVKDTDGKDTDIDNNQLETLFRTLQKYPEMDRSSEEDMASQDIKQKCIQEWVDEYVKTITDSYEREPAIHQAAKAVIEPIAMKWKKNGLRALQSHEVRFIIGYFITIIIVLAFIVMLSLIY